MTFPDLTTSLQAAIKHADENGIEIPYQMRVKAVWLGAIKAAGNLAEINKQYHDATTQALLDYFEGSGPITAPRNAFKRAMVEGLGAAFDLGWADGGGDGVPSGDALDWFNARIEAEFGFIDMLFQEAKELRKEEDFDYFAWATQRADGYTRTTREVYNVGKLRASKDVMVTFLGDDGAESCPECQQLKGQRHRVSWFVRRNFVPPHGTGLSCHRGRYCRHFLQNDKGEQVTV